MFVLPSKQALIIALVCLLFSVVSSKPKKPKKPTCDERVKKAKVMISNLEKECNIDFKKMEEPPVNVKSVWGTYVRWGRTVCPENASMFYEGIAGGSHYAKGGSGANYVCLPKEPEWGKIVSGVGDIGAYIYGAEYQFGKVYSNPFLATNAPDKESAESLHDNDVPCIVCQVPRSVAMVPARHTCPEGWTLEYKGYLVAEHHTHPQNSVFECMDEAPEPVQDSQENKDGALFYSVQAICGSLPCPAYRQGAELTCVVCSK